MKRTVAKQIAQLTAWQQEVKMHPAQPLRRQQRAGKAAVQRKREGNMSGLPLKTEVVVSSKPQLPADLREALIELLAQALVAELTQSGTTENQVRTEPPGQALPQQNELAALRDKLLPLAHARRKPGRPRKVQSGHNSGTGSSRTLDRTEWNEGTPAMEAGAPRLLVLNQAAS